MPKPPLWFTVVAALALLWNLAGLAAVVADLQLSAAEIAALPAAQQQMYAARPAWSVAASVVAVLGGTLGSLGLLLRRRWALVALYASLAGIVVQDIGIFVVAGAVQALGAGPVVMQTVVLLVAAGLVVLGRRAAAKGWLA